MNTNTDFIKTLKEKVSIVDVVGERVRLKKVGSNFMGLCPFHGERSPSFSVSEKKGIYHCFGCQKGGDSIRFIQDLDGLTFLQAVQVLAAKAGLILPKEMQSSLASNSKNQDIHFQDQNEIYFKLNRFVAQFYHEKLLSSEGKHVRDYLQKRGITEETIKKAYLGYAPNDWAKLYEFLCEKKAPIDKAEILGLVRKRESVSVSERSHYDLFRDRLMFPILDQRGRVCAFGGRALSATDQAKYLNSQESPVFHKGKGFYGLFRAQKDIRAEDAVIVVEGYMDCLSLQQAGFENTVASLGTAVTVEQVKLLKKLTSNVILIFDGDSAGQEASSRVMETFLAEEMLALGVKLPDNLDPDDFVQKFGADALRLNIKQAPSLLDKKIVELSILAQGRVELQAKYLDQAASWISKIPSQTARQIRAQEVSSLFGVKLELVEKMVQKHGGAKSRFAASSQSVQGVRGSQFKSHRDLKEFDVLDLKLVELLATSLEFVVEFFDFEKSLDGIESEGVRNFVMSIFKVVQTNKSTDQIDFESMTNDDYLLSIVRRSLLKNEERPMKAEEVKQQQEERKKEVKDLSLRLTQRALERKKEMLRARILKLDPTRSAQENEKLIIEYQELVKTLSDGRSVLI